MKRFLKKHSLKRQSLKVRPMVDRSQMDEEEEAEAGISKMNPGNISWEDVSARGARWVSTDMLRGSRDPLQLLIRKESRANNKKMKRVRAKLSVQA